MRKARYSKELIFLVCSFVVVAVAVFVVAEMGKRSQVQAQPGEVLKMNAEQVREWVKDKPLAFVEFFSPTCSACQMAGPVIEKLVAEMGLNFAAVNVHYPENHKLMQELKVTATPTIFVFSNGEVVEGPVVGFIGEENYRALFEKMVEMYASE